MTTATPTRKPETPSAAPGTVSRPRMEWRRLLTRSGFIPYVLIHLACLTVIWVGWSPVAVAVAVGLYVIRMFAITGWYHRYFSHRTFQTSRPVQLLFAMLGASSGQKGPLWWAAHHRTHHRHSDEEGDIHSPRLHGVLWAHMGWIWTEEAKKTDVRQIPDLVKFPELRWVDRFHGMFTIGLAASMYGLGALLERVAPGLGTSGWQMLVWGFCISTTLLYHGTYTINSLCHVFGSRRYPTTDDSRNNLWLALITLGEGWHNNHHRYPGSTRQGFYWWEIDITYYTLWLLERARLVRNLRAVPEPILTAGRRPPAATVRSG